MPHRYLVLAVLSVALIDCPSSRANLPGAFTQIAVTGETAPGSGGTFVSFQPPVSMYFQAEDSNGVSGVYVDSPSGLAVMADTATPSIQQFTSFGDPSVSDDSIVFTAHYSTAGGDQQGIFAYGPYYNFNPPNGGPHLQQLLASGAVAPDSNGAHFENFLSAGAGLYDDPDIFLATLDDGREGIYS